jgi:5-methylcytosine-specific restriction endonuclease McrA
MKKMCGKCGVLHDHDFNCTVGKFDKYYKTSMTYKLRNNRRWWATRDEALERDNHLCCACRFDDQPFYNAYRLEVHHILDVKDRPDLVYELSNTITLCQHHHREVHARNLDLEKLLGKLGRSVRDADRHPPTS